MAASSQPIERRVPLQQCVVHERAGSKTRLLRRHKPLHELLSHPTVGILEHAQKRTDTDLLTVNLTLHLRDQLVGQPDPRKPARRRRLGQDPLLGYAELLARGVVHPTKMMGRELDLRTRVREQPLHGVLRSSAPLQLKEPQRLLNLGAPLRNKPIQRAGSRVREIPLMRERGVQKRSHHRLTDPRPLLCRGSELRGVKLQHAPAVPRGEISGAPRGVVKQRSRTVRTATVDERVEIPHRRRQTRVTDLSRSHGHPAILSARDLLCDRREHLGVTPTPPAFQ